MNHKNVSTITPIFLFLRFVNLVIRSHVHPWHFVYIRNWFGKRQIDVKLPNSKSNETS